MPPPIPRLYANPTAATATAAFRRVLSKLPARRSTGGSPMSFKQTWAQKYNEDEEFADLIDTGMDATIYGGLGAGLTYWYLNKGKGDTPSDAAAALQKWELHCDPSVLND